jgi:hypothetical protein
MLRPLAVVPWREPAPIVSIATLTAGRSYALGLAGLTLAGLALRLVLLARFPLREDEALYASWALHALHEDPRFLTVWPDKPPIFLWLLGGVLALLGPSAAAARWLGIAASVLTIPLVATGARRLWGSPAAGLAAGLAYALNPFALSFAPTVYTDPLLVLWGTLALVMALCGRAVWAGVWLGAALMTKQQGLLYLPVVLALALQGRQWGERIHHKERKERKERKGQSGEEVRFRVRFLPLLSTAYTLLPPFGFTLLGMAAVVLPILLWDSTRWAVAPSPWDLATRTYAPLALAPWTAWLPRLLAWSELLWYLAARAVVWLVAAVLWVAAGLSAARRPPPAAWILLGWGFGFLALHVVTTVQIWDRYLLPLAPLWAWGLAWPAARLADAAASGGLRRAGHALLLIAALCLIPPGLVAARGGLPIGGDHGDYTGLDTAMARVAAQPGRQVLYHHSLGWHARFYLDAALRQRRIELRWFSSPVYLADNAAKTPYPPAVLILPDWATPPDLALHLALRGLTLRRDLRAGRFTVYTLVHRPPAACDWCRSMAAPEPAWPWAIEPAGMSRP